jgi:hypothetical protein
MKGILLILLFTGELEYRAFNYNSTSIWFPTDNEKIVACSEQADKIRNKISEHSFTDPRGQGWYLKDGTGTFQGYIC